MTILTGFSWSKRQESEYLNLSLENQLDGISLELHVQWRARLEMFPHYMTIAGIQPPDPHIRFLPQHRGQIVAIVLIVPVPKTIGLHRVDVLSFDAGNVPAGFRGPQYLALPRIHLENDGAGFSRDVNLPGELDTVRTGRGRVDVHHAFVIEKDSEHTHRRQT